MAIIYFSAKCWLVPTSRKRKIEVEMTESVILNYLKAFDCIKFKMEKKEKVKKPLLSEKNVPKRPAWPHENLDLLT